MTLSSKASLAVCVERFRDLLDIYCHIEEIFIDTQNLYTNWARLCEIIGL